ncbi:5,6-dimethylbenzimidazole synthase [compost metagenome]
MSLFDPLALGELLGLPEGAEPLALLCLGPVSEFYPRPMLVEEGWAEENPLADMLFENHWGQQP